MKTSRAREAPYKWSSPSPAAQTAGLGTRLGSQSRTFEAHVVHQPTLNMRTRALADFRPHCQGKFFKCL